MANFSEINGCLSRRRFLLAAAAAPLLAAAVSPINRSRISAISDEVGSTPEDALAFAAKFGLQWLELRDVPGAHKPYFFLEGAELRDAAESFKSHGLGISFLNTNLLKFGLPGTVPVRRKNETPEALAKREGAQQVRFDRRLDDLRKCIAAAHAFNCDKIRIFTFSRVAQPHELYPRIVEILQPFIKEADSAGVKLLIENEASQNVGTSAETAEILKLLPSKTVGTNWDSLNGVGLGEKPFPDGYMSLPKDRIWNVQIKGHSILDPAQRLDWPAIFQQLEKDGYTGELGLETHYFDGTNLERSRLAMTEILRLAAGA